MTGVKYLIKLSHHQLKLRDRGIKTSYKTKRLFRIRIQILQSNNTRPLHYKIYKQFKLQSIRDISMQNQEKSIKNLQAHSKKSANNLTVKIIGNNRLFTVEIRKKIVDFIIKPAKATELVLKIQATKMEIITPKTQTVAPPLIKTSKRTPRKPL